VARISPTFFDGYTRNFGKLPVIVKAWMGLSKDRNASQKKSVQGVTFLGGGLS
jgi:hypothetical protein